MKLVFTLLALGLAASAQADCQADLARHRQADMSLSYEQFDQTEDRGFRALAKAGCYAEAEQLIVQYMQANPRGQQSLRWHAAQMAASAGHYAQAAAHAHRMLAEAKAADDSPLMWNDYVLASIAFFERDKAGLQRHRDVIARKGQGFWGNRMNLNLLDTMLEHFDLGYAEIGEKAAAAWDAKPAAE
ncbi:hypothetical protein AACH06_18855 [Ideonella sp. DXS29W]|uniref:Tetratricopeptide repeat protein n=1 Tax=Ideonella lacteola TaxID=2984193 RepID=A0ABU9BWB8_9BURK